MSDTPPTVGPDGKPIVLLAPQRDYKHYFFLLYSSDPTRGRVGLYIDGEDQKIGMKHENFVKLIIETIGWSLEAAVKETLNTYGTLWMIDRETAEIRRIVPTGSEDLINVQKEIQESVKAKTATELSPINGLVDPRYAGGQPSVPAMENSPTPFDNANARHKPKNRFGFNIPMRR
jgi:hypothetical protein